MKNRIEKNVIKSNAFLALLAITMLTTAVTKTAMAKSLYVIADIKGASEDRTQPVQAYDIGVDGTLTFQAQHDIPHRMLGAVGMAIDADSGYLFITYEASNVIQLLDPITMVDAGTTRAPDAWDLAGIKYDHEKKLLYCVDRGINNLYVYNWYPETTTLTHVPGSPFSLRYATAYGIALNEIDDLLYVANATNTVTVYRTSDWQLVNTISLSRIAISIAVDVKNGFIYTGGGYAGNMFLTQYHLATRTEKEVQVEPDAGVMGLRVDIDTGLVYISTGKNNEPGGDNLLVYDTALNQIDIVTAIGNPTDLAIPGKDIGYNPLNLNKQVLRGASASTGYDNIKTVGAGDIYTYGISFNNNNNYAVTDVTIFDKLPPPGEVIFVSADDDGVNGFYNYDEHTKTQTYTWTYKELPPGTSTLLELTVQVNPEMDAGRIITNSVTINSNETPPTTTSVDVMTASNALSLKKGILGTPEGQITRVNNNDIITYTIDFDNKDNDFPVTNVIVFDELPKDVTFLIARDETGKAVGKYDDKAHTYTWTFDSLAPGAAVHLELDVSVNPGLPLGTKITNIVTIDSDETLPSSASVDAVTYYNYKPLNITNKALDMEGNEIEWVDPNERFTYQICFDNNNDSKVTDVKIVDELSDEVIFVEADNSKATGKYDRKAHTYTWSYGSLDPGLTACLELVVDVNQYTPPKTIISNTAIIYSNETEPNQADVNLPVGEPVKPPEPEPVFKKVADLSITPDVLRRNGTSRNIMAVVEFPRDIRRSDIDTDYQPKLYHSENQYITRGTQFLSGSNSSPKVTILFNRAKLMDKLDGYGKFKLKVIGKLSDENHSERYYYGYATIFITRFAGD